MNRPMFAQRGQGVPAQQTGLTPIEDLIRTAKARIATIDAQMTAFRDMSAERASLVTIVEVAEAQLAPKAEAEAPTPAPSEPVKHLPKRMA